MKKNRKEVKIEELTLALEGARNKEEILENFLKDAEKYAGITTGANFGKYRKIIEKYEKSVNKENILANYIANTCYAVAKEDVQNVRGYLAYNRDRVTNEYGLHEYMGKTVKEVHQMMDEEKWDHDQKMDRTKMFIDWLNPFEFDKASPWEHGFHECFHTSKFANMTTEEYLELKEKFFNETIEEYIRTGIRCQ